MWSTREDMHYLWGQEVPWGPLPYKSSRDVPLFRVSFFSINSWIRYEKLIRNSETGYDYLLKNNTLLLSRTTDYCFPIVFGIFYNLIIPKQGIKMQMFFLNRLWRFLENLHLPVKLHSNAPPPPPRWSTHESYHQHPWGMSSVPMSHIASTVNVSDRIHPNCMESSRHLTYFYQTWQTFLSYN